MRVSDGGSPDADMRKERARNVEKDMKEARRKLLALRKRIDEGNRAHRFRSKRIVQPRRDPELSDSDALSSYSEDDGHEEQHYEKNVRRDTDRILATLNDIENEVRFATDQVAALSTEKAASGSSKSSRGGKKKQQEARRRERKEKRRREQERTARETEPGFTAGLVRKAHGLDIAI